MFSSICLWLVELWKGETFGRLQSGPNSVSDVSDAVLFILRTGNKFTAITNFGIFIPEHSRRGWRMGYNKSNLPSHPHWLARTILLLYSLLLLPPLTLKP